MGRVWGVFVVVSYNIGYIKGLVVFVLVVGVFVGRVVFI